MSWIEQRIDDLAREGAFDDLPGSGRPIEDLDREYSPGWWAERWVKRDAARRGSEPVRNRLADDITAALLLARPAARERLLQIKGAIAVLNAHLDSTQQLPDFDVDVLLIHKQWPP
jgi:hypothetical protein